MFYLSSFILPLKFKRKVLIINGLNGHIDLLNVFLWERLKKIIKENRFEALNPQLIQSLKKRKYIFSSKSQEKKIYNGRVKKLRKLLDKDKNLAITVDFSENCNLACFYCFNKSRRTKEQMTISHLDKVFEIIDSLVKKGYKVHDNQIVLFGGEPLMHENRFLLEHFLQKLNKTKYKTFILTNGVTINDYLDLLHKYQKIIAGFQITVDGPAVIHDKRRVSKDYPKTFFIITNNIDKLLKSNFKVSMRVNTDKENFPFLPQLAQFVKKKKWSKNKHFYSHLGLVCNNRVKDCSCNPNSQSKEFINKLRNLSKKYPELSVIFNEEALYSNAQKILMNALEKKSRYPCINFCMTGGGKSLTFAADGKIYACLGSVGLPVFCLGKYFPKLLWNKRNLSKWQNRLSVNMEKCKKCPLIFICGGECPLNAYEQNGNIMVPACLQAIKNLQGFMELNQEKILKFAKNKLD